MSPKINGSVKEEEEDEEEKECGKEVEDGFEDGGNGETYKAKYGREDSRQNAGVLSDEMIVRRPG